MRSIAEETVVETGDTDAQLLSAPSEPGVG